MTARYATANGTATAPGDYTAIAATTLTFAPGQTSKTITVAVKGDTLDEANETFFVNLSSAVNATIADGQGLGTIRDDDPAPSMPIGFETADSQKGHARPIVSGLGGLVTRPIPLGERRDAIIVLIEAGSGLDGTTANHEIHAGEGNFVSPLEADTGGERQASAGRSRLGPVRRGRLESGRVRPEGSGVIPD